MPRSRGAFAQPAEALASRISSDIFPSNPRAATARCCRSRSARPKTFIAGFLACVVLSFGLWPFLGENFFPDGRFRADPDARSRPARHPHRGDRAAVRPHRTDRAQHHPARSARQHRRQHRPAVFRHQHGLSEHRHDRPRGRRRPDQPQGGSRADGVLHQTAAHHLAAEISRERHSRSCPPTSCRKSSISACRRRSTCRSSATTRRPTTPTPRTCSSASARSPASPICASSRCSTIRRSMSTSTARSPARSG